jgi:hypothetical protein
MKKIINGRRYDTETAQQVAEYQHSYQSEFDYYTETLYRKKGGEFFLHGYGHAASPYCEWVGSSTRSAGERIVPMTYAEAQKWAEEHLDADAYEAIFGEVEEDGTRTVLALSLTAAQLEQIKRLAAQDGATKLSPWILSKLGIS